MTFGLDGHPTISLAYIKHSQLPHERLPSLAHPQVSNLSRASQRSAPGAIGVTYHRGHKLTTLEANMAHPLTCARLAHARGRRA